MLFFTWLKILRTSRAESKVCILMQNLFCVWFIRYGEIVARASEKIYRKIKTWIVQSYNPFWETHVRMYVCVSLPRGGNSFLLMRFFSCCCCPFFAFSWVDFLFELYPGKEICALWMAYGKRVIWYRPIQGWCVYIWIYTQLLLFSDFMTSNQARLPAELKHINKRRKRN